MITSHDALGFIFLEGSGAICRDLVVDDVKAEIW